MTGTPVGPTLQVAILHHDPSFALQARDDLDAALAWCRARAAHGETVLFSPGCASSPPFRDHVRRSERFVAAVGAS